MKKYVFISFALLLCVSSKAQTYKSCLDGEIIRWSFLDQPDCADPFFYLNSREIVAHGDVLLNNVMYKKLYIDTSFDYNDAEESNTNWKNYQPGFYYEWENFYIRESDDASQLYIYNSLRNEEYLMSDMNLQEGQTFQLFGMREAIVDEVYVENDLKHIQWHLTSPGLSSSPFTFIESIGSNMWFIYPDGCSRYPFGLNCFQNQNTFYKNNGIIDYWDFADYPCGCYFQSGTGTPSVSENAYTVFIQKDKMEILFVSEVKVDISIYDLQGKLHCLKNNVSGKSIEISTASLPKGVYILTVYDRENRQNNAKKFMLQ